MSCAEAYCCKKNHVSVVVPAFPQQPQNRWWGDHQPTTSLLLQTCQTLVWNCQLVNFKLPEASEDGLFGKCGNLQQTTSIVVVQCCVSSPTSVHNLDQSMTAKASSTIEKVWPALFILWEDYMFSRFKTTQRWWNSPVPYRYQMFWSKRPRQIKKKRREQRIQ